MRKPVVQRPDDVIVKGRFAELLPWNFAKPFGGEYGEQSLPLLVSFEHCDGWNLPAEADLSPFPPGQQRVADRVASIRFNVETAATPHLSPWQGKDGNGWPVMAILPLLDRATTPQQAVEAFGADGLGPDVPIIIVPVFKGFTRKEVRALKPFIPTS